MTKKWWLILGLVLALVVVIGGFVIAEQSDEPRPMIASRSLPPEPRFGGAPMMPSSENPIIMWERAAKTLELTPAQKKQIETIFLDNKKKTIQLKADLEIQQIDLFTSLRDPNSDDAKVKEITKKIGKLTSEMLETHIDGILKAKKVLTPEQVEKTIQLIERMKHRGILMGKGQHPMMGPGMMQPMRHRGNKSGEEQEEKAEETETK